MHRTTLRTWLASKSSGSPISGWNDPLVKAEVGDVAALSRSMDFGVNTMSGLFRPDMPCQRSRWK